MTVKISGLFIAIVACLIACSGCTTGSSVDTEPIRVISTGHPPVDPAPPISVAEAVRIAQAFAAAKRADVADSYVDRIWLTYDMRNRRRWIVSLASPKSLYFFVCVSMTGRASVAPSSGLLSKDPFIEFNYNPPARWSR